MGNYSSVMDILEMEETICDSCNSQISNSSKNYTYINMVCGKCTKLQEEYYHNSCYKNHMKNHFKNGFICSNCIFSNTNKT